MWQMWMNHCNMIPVNNRYRDHPFNHRIKDDENEESDKKKGPKKPNQTIEWHLFSLDLLVCINHIFGIWSYSNWNERLLPQSAPKMYPVFSLLPFSALVVLICLCEEFDFMFLFHVFDLEFRILSAFYNKISWFCAHLSFKTNISRSNNNK